MIDLPYLGHGIGLRTSHYQTVVEELPPVDWFEVISENFMVAGGNPRRVLRRVREHYPVVLHGVSLSLGSTDPLDARYLDELAALAAEVEPAWLSDHLCWGSYGGHHSHDLLPLPYTEEALAHVAERVLRVQDRLKRQILVENVSSYVSFQHSTMSEWEFLAALTERADCGLLLDVNNIFVSAHNHRFDAHAFLNGVPRDRVVQTHLAGHMEEGPLLLDTHDHPVCDGVWELYRAAVERFGAISTLVEWDDHIPPFERVLEESDRARAVENDVLAAADVAEGKARVAR
jgi:uncharacterized protein (UPF0276 family)